MSTARDFGINSCSAKRPSQGFKEMDKMLLNFMELGSTTRKVLWNKFLCCFGADDFLIGFRILD